MEAIKPLEIVRNPKIRFSGEKEIMLDAAIAFANKFIRDNIKDLQRGNLITLTKDAHIGSWLPEFDGYEVLAKKLKKAGWLTDYVFGGGDQGVSIRIQKQFLLKKKKIKK
ncbi:MAG: hypothetical protein KBC98_01855 [Candidatus Pacebacteria bacterium]|nr:hypothetical protein [Candidatus Paceibacterota bacterium]